MNSRRIYKSFLGAMLGGAVCLGTVTAADAADR